MSKFSLGIHFESWHEYSVVSTESVSIIEVTSAESSGIAGVISTGTVAEVSADAAGVL